MRNPVLNVLHCYRHWKSFRPHAGVFTVADAWMGWQRVLLPARLGIRADRSRLIRETEVEKRAEGACRIRIKQNGWIFYWLGAPMYITLEQELNPRHPHHYTTRPICLASSSLVFDVGACEGLFAFRMIKQNLAGQVICFEPHPIMAHLLRLAAAENGVANRIRIEQMAVSKESGLVSFEPGETSFGGRLTSSNETGGPAVNAVALDTYCRSTGLKVKCDDLIKVDAEGADFDILRGAEQIIHENRPQIAVTTYHEEDHALGIYQWLKRVQPAYRFRLKGFSWWMGRPKPVLLQASTI